MAPFQVISYWSLSSVLYIIDYRKSAMIELSSLDPAAAWQPLALPPPLTLSGPLGLSSFGQDRLLIVDSGHARLLVLDPMTGVATILDPAGSSVGPLRQPSAATLAPDGAIIIADSGNHRLVRASSLLDPTWTSFERSALAPDLAFHSPQGVHVDTSGALFVTDPGADRLVRFPAFGDANGAVIPLPSAGLPARPYAITLGIEDGFVVSDLLNSRLLLFAADASLQSVIDGSADRSLIAPVSVVLSGEDLLVADAAANRLSRWKFDYSAGVWAGAETLLGAPGPAGGPVFSSLCGLTILEMP